MAGAEMMVLMRWKTRASTLTARDRISVCIESIPQSKHARYLVRARKLVAAEPTRVD